MRRAKINARDTEREGERDASARLRGHQGFALPPVKIVNVERAQERLINNEVYI